MLIDKNVQTTPESLLLKKKILSAARSYATTEVNLKSLSFRFSVSENTLANWFCEAVSKRYIESDDMCVAIMEKHIKEYESFHNIPSSSLRSMYNTAFKERSIAELTKSTVIPIN